MFERHVSQLPAYRLLCQRHARVFFYRHLDSVPVMTIGERIESRRKAVGIKSQAELARRADIPQTTMNGLIKRPYRWSPHLSRLARELGTTVPYLTGETDDPDLNAPLPPSEPRIQHVSLPVALPNELALVDAFRALLMVSRRMNEDELAHELAKRLPTLLRVAAGAIVAPTSADTAAASEAIAPREADRRERRRA